MSEIIVHFKGNKEFLEQSLNDAEIKITDKQEQINSFVSTAQNQLLFNQTQLLTNTQNLDQELAETSITLTQTLQQLSITKDEILRQIELGAEHVDFSGQLLREQIDRANELEEKATNTSQKISKLEQRMEMLNELIEEAKLQAQQTEKKTFDIKTAISTATQTLSALGGFIALFQATTEEQIDIGFQAAMSLALNSLNQIILLMAVSQTTGNIPLFFALGSLASSAASTINTIRSLNRQAQARIDAEKRRQQNRKIDI